MTLLQLLPTAQQITTITNHVNAYRAKHQAPPMTWAPAIASVSQQWSYRLLSTGAFEHSDTANYGENLAQLKGYGTDLVTLYKKAIDLWYNEVALYNFSKPDFSPSTGHFTCLVWVASTSFGMGLTLDTTTNTVDIVMNTSPAGNFIGQFAQNVLPVMPVSPAAPLTPITNKQEIINELNNLIKELNANKRKSAVIADIQNVIQRLSSA